MTTTAQSNLRLRVEPLPGGRSRVHAEINFVDHVDQFTLKSERQRLRFAQACDAKEPGCLDEVLGRLECEANQQGMKYSADHDDGCRFVFTTLDKIAPEPVDWLWEKYIPAGAVTILEGEPGVGKTMLLCDLAARVSRGFLAPNRQPAFDEPGFDPEPIPGQVWWFAGGDHVAQTLQPRLTAANANPAFIRVIEGTEDQKTGNCRPVAFPADFHSLWKSQSAAPRLVVVDPLSAFTGGSLHQATAHKVIGELAKFAAATGAAVVVVRPLNRRVGASASERGSAGPTLTADARSALLLAQHPDDPAKQVLAVLKSNLCAKAESLELQIEDLEFRASQERERLESLNELSEPSMFDGQDSGRSRSRLADAPRIAWLGRSPFMADELVRSRGGAVVRRSPFEQKKVEEWLAEKLSAGPKPAKEIGEQAELDEIPPILLRRAQICLNVVPTGRNGSTTWRLPEPRTPTVERTVDAEQRSTSDRGDLALASSGNDDDVQAFALNERVNEDARFAGKGREIKAKDKRRLRRAVLGDDRRKEPRP